MGGGRLFCPGNPCNVQATTLLSALYLVMLGTLALRRTRCDESALVHLFMVYAPGGVWLIPLALLTVEATRERNLAAALLNGLTAIAIVFPIMDFRLGPNAHRILARDRIRVVTFNIFGGSLGIERCLAFLRRTDADIICLQEAWWAFDHADAQWRAGAPPVESLPKILHAFADWSVAQSLKEHEMLVLSRHPITHVEERPLGRRFCLVCTIEHPKGTLRVVNVHLSPPATSRSLRDSGKPISRFFLDTARERRIEADALARLVMESAAPTVVAGDFNSPPHAYTHRVLRPLLGDVFRQSGHGFGYTYPRALPLWRIDYILTSPSIVPRRCTAENVGGSDHRPLVADLYPITSP